MTAEPWDIGTGVAGYAWHASRPRAVVLLQHGYGDHTQSYVERSNRLIPRLLELGFSVYGFDMRGSGHSPGARGATDVEQAVADHLAARRVLRGQQLPVFLFGHSLGGLVTATSVLRDARDVAGVVVLAPAIKYEVNRLLRLVARAGAFLLPTFSGPLPAGEPGALTRVAESAEAIVRDPLMYLGRVKWVTLGSGAAVSHANWAHYGRLTVPLLAVHGTDDRSTDPTGSRDLVEAASSADKTLHLVDGGLHALLDDADRETTVQAILDWMTKRLRSRPGGEEPAAS